MDFRAGWRVFKIKGLVEHVKRLVKRIFRQVHIKTLAVNITIGFDDPADGGMIFAFIGAVKPFIRLPKQHEFEVQSVLSERSFVEGYVRCVFHLQPIKLIFSVLRWVFSVPTLKMAGIMISNAWKNRNRKRMDRKSGIRLVKICHSILRIQATLYKIIIRYLPIIAFVRRPLELEDFNLKILCALNESAAFLTRGFKDQSGTPHILGDISP